MMSFLISKIGQRALFSILILLFLGAVGCASRAGTAADQARLVDEDESLSVRFDTVARITAVGKLTNQTLLAEIALEDEDSSIRNAAVKRVADQAVLAKIIEEEQSYNIRLQAAERLVDQSLLSKVAVKDPNGDLRQIAVEKLTDQVLLSRIAVEDESWCVREAAVKKLTDQDLLAKVAVKAVGDVREIAFKKLSDQSLLGSIALEDLSPANRLIAVQKLTDQVVLGEVALKDKHIMVRLAAVFNLTDQAVLMKIASEESALAVRYTAIANLTDRNVLADLSDNHKFRHTAEVASIRLFLTDPLIAGHLGETKVLVSAEAISRRYNKIFGPGEGGDKPGERISIRVRGRTLPKEIAVTWETDFQDEEDSLEFKPANINITTLAKEILAGFPPNLLVIIATEFEDVWIRAVAVDRLTDAALLEEIAGKDASEYIRIIARQKLESL